MNLTPEKLAQISASLGEAKKRQDKLTAAERAAKKAEREGAKSEARALKASARAEKAAQKAQTKSSKSSGERVPNYMQKIEKLRAGLPEATGPWAVEVHKIIARFEDNSFTDADLTVMAAHLGFEQRRRGILASANPPSKVSVGDTVEIQNCVNRKFIGAQGIVEKVRRIRAFVRVDGYDIPAYTFVSDLKVLSSGVQENQGVNILDLSEDEPEQVESSDEAQTGT